MRTFTLSLLIFICGVQVGHFASLSDEPQVNIDRNLTCLFKQSINEFDYNVTCAIDTLEINSNDFVITPPANASLIKYLLLQKKPRVHFFPREIAKSLPNLKQITFDGLALSKVTQSDLKDLGELQFLYLDSNFITEIEADAFWDLKSLELIDLDYNKLTSLPPTLFKPLPNLKTVSVHDNLLTTLDARIFSNNKQLYSIKLHNNEIDELSPYLLEGLHPAEIFLQKNKCINKMYRDNSIVTTFAVDMDKFCKPGRLRIVEQCKEHAIIIIGVCVFIILAFILFLTCKGIVKRRRRRQRFAEVSKLEMSHSQRVNNNKYSRRDTAMSVASETEHIYDVIDASKLNVPYHHQAMYVNVRSLGNDGRMKL